MKVVLLAGGLGTRISEESHVRPKPMIEIGGRPILWHIMKIYSHFGLNDFVICCGYRGYMIKEFFANYRNHTSDLTIDLARNTIAYHGNGSEPWRITLVDTGEATMTGGRLKRVAVHIGGEDFCLTYGDGVSNVDIAALVQFHRAHGKLATVTAVMPPARYGALEITPSGNVSRFVEKPLGDGGWINGGFFVLSPRVLDLIDGDSVAWEQEPLARLAKLDQLMAYQHSGFWQAMDTLRDKNHLEDLLSRKEAPWVVWR